MSAARGLAGSSALMFSGTLVSRLLGMVREPLLLGAAIGINYGAANAFAVANRLPNLIHLLIAGGVLNAVLVPQIVRAIKGEADGGQQYVNRLLTMSAAALALITVVLVAGAGVLVSVYASDLPPQWFNLAVVFAVWTIPQLFFYGMYTVLGQILNARGNFGPYMWAPALNNVVAIAGLAVYLAVYGGVDATPTGDASIWTGDRLALLAGTATLGVAAQAGILLWPLHRSGFRYRPEWGLRGSGLGRASRVAMWVFGSVVVGQLVNILVVRAAVHAVERGGGALDVPGPAAYNPAYTLFILPNSLVVVSLITALFTRMSGNVVSGQLEKVRADLSLGLRTVGLFTVFGTGALMVLALPVMRVLTGTVSYTETQSIARVAVAMLAGLVGMGALTVVQRVYYAFEDTRQLFWIQLPSAMIVAVGAVAAMFLPPQWTLVGVGVAMTVSNTVAAAMCYVALRRHLPSLDGGRVVRSHVRLTVAATPAVLIGWGLLHLLGVSDADLSVVGAAWRTVLVGLVMAVLYLLLLRVLRVEELATMMRSLGPLLFPVTRRLPPPAARLLEMLGLPVGGPAVSAPTPPPAPPAVVMPTGPATTPGGPAPGTGAVPLRTLSSKSPDEGAGSASTGSGTLDGHHEERGTLTGTTVLGGRYQLGAPLPATLPRTTRWQARDLILDREVEAIILRPDDPVTPATLDAARRAALVEDPRLLSVLDVGSDEHIAYVITEPVPGLALSEIASAGPLPADQARAIIAEAASALETARRRGIRHLALHPGSVRVTPDDRVVVTGLAVDAVLLGTEDENPVTAARQDATSLVRLLYLALTGRWPGSEGPVSSEDTDAHREETVISGSAPAPRADLPLAPVVDGSPVPPSSVQPDVPAELDTLCVQVLTGAVGAPSNPAQLIRELSPWADVDHRTLPGAAAQGAGRRGWHRLSDAHDDSPSAPDEVYLFAARTAAGGAAGAGVLPPPPHPEEAQSGDSGATHQPDPSAWWPHDLGTADPTRAPDFDDVVDTEATDHGPHAPRHISDSGALAALTALQRTSSPRSQSTQDTADDDPESTPPSEDDGPDQPDLAPPPDPSAWQPHTLRAADPTRAPDFDDVVDTEATDHGPHAPRHISDSGALAALTALQRTSSPRSQTPENTATAAPPADDTTEPATPPEDQEPVAPPPDPSDWQPHHLGAADPTHAPAFDDVVDTEATDHGPHGARHSSVTGVQAALAQLQAVGSTVAENARGAAASAGPALGRATAAGRQRYATFTERRRARAEERAAEDVQLEREREARLRERDPEPVEPADGYRPPQERRIDPTPVALGIGVLVVLVMFGLAVRGLTAPVEERTLPEVAPVTPTQPAENPTPAAEVEDEAPEPDAEPPVIASLTPFDPQGDGAENPELTPLALDGDPDTFWRSRRYDNPEYGMKDGIGLRIALEEPTEVSEIELTLRGEGGLVQVSASSLDNALAGDFLAESEMTRSTVLSFDPVRTDLVVLWFPRLPVADSDGLNRIELAEVTVR